MGRREISAAQKAQEKESKRARGALSCAECRRLKLKCDKTVPCSSCKRRGCSAICPNGSLITGQGTRFVLADTEKLHHKISQMSDRIRNLEDALAILQATVAPGEPHPLLGRDFLRIKSSIELHSAVDSDEMGLPINHAASGSMPNVTVNGKSDSSPSGDRSSEERDDEPDDSELIDAFGTLAIRDDGGTVFYGRSAGSESLLIGESLPTPSSPLLAFNTSLSATTIIGSSNPLRSRSVVNPARVLSRQTLAPTLNTGNGNVAPKDDSWNSDIPSAIHHLATSFPFPSTSASLQNLTSLAAQPTTTNHLSSQPPKSPQKINLDHLVQTYLPPWEEANKMASFFLQHTAWCFGAVVEGRQVEEEVLPLWYPEAKYKIEVTEKKLSNGFGVNDDVNSSTKAVVENGTESSSSLTKSRSSVALDSLTLTPLKPKPTAHDLALLFTIFCCACALDVEGEVTASIDVSVLPNFFNSSSSNQPNSAAAGASSRKSAYWYQLAKATMGLEPILERAPVVATVQTLVLMAVYELFSEGQGGIDGEGVNGSGVGTTPTPSNSGCTEKSWVLIGLACKLAQSLGLHRDSARWKLPPAEVQKRRALFWELYIMDCWQSLATGRLSTFSLPYIDCELPADTEQTLSNDGSVQHSLHHWKANFGYDCISQVIQGMLASKAPKYSVVLELDRKIRETEVPDVSQAITQGQNMGLAQTMKCFMPTNYRDLTLLYIHRGFFAHAITTHPLDPIKSQYSPSFLAGYRTACSIISSVKQQFVLYPAQIAKFWVLWTHAFSAAVMLASVVTHASQSKVAPTALLELRTAVELFEKAASYGGRAVRFLPILQRLQSKAQQTYLESNSGIPPALSMTELFKPASTTISAALSNHQDPDMDELSIFSGKTHTIIAPASLTQPSPLLSSPGSGFGLGSALRVKGLIRVNSPLGQALQPSLSSISSSSSSSAGDADLSHSPVIPSQPQSRQVHIQPQQPQSLSQALSQAQPYIVPSNTTATTSTTTTNKTRPSQIRVQSQSSLSQSPSQMPSVRSASHAQLQTLHPKTNANNGSGTGAAHVSLSQLITSSTAYVVDSGGANVNVGTVGLVGLDDSMDMDMEVDVANSNAGRTGATGPGGSSNPLLGSLGRFSARVIGSDGSEARSPSTDEDAQQQQQQQQQQRNQWQQMQDHLARQVERQRLQEKGKQTLEQQERERQHDLERQRMEQQQQFQAERQKLEQQQQVERENMDLERQRLEQVAAQAQAQAQQHQRQQQEQNLLRHQSMGNLVQFAQDAQQQQHQLHKPGQNQPNPNQSHPNINRHHSSGNLHQHQHMPPPPPPTRMVQAQPITLPRHHSSGSLSQFAQDQHLQIPQFSQQVPAQQQQEQQQAALPRHHSSGNLRYFGQLESPMENHHGPLRRQSLGNLQQTAQQQQQQQPSQPLQMAQPFDVPRSQSSFQFNYAPQQQQQQQQAIQNQDIGTPGAPRHHSPGNVQHFPQEFQQHQHQASSPADPFHIPRHRSSGNLQFYAQEQQGQQQASNMFGSQSQGSPLQSIPEDSDGSVQQAGRSGNLPHSATYPNLQQHFQQQQQVRQQPPQQQQQQMSELGNNGFLQQQTMVVDPSKPATSFSALHYHSAQSPTVQSPTSFAQQRSPLDYQSQSPPQIWTNGGMMIETVNSLKHSASPEQSPALHSMSQYPDASSGYQMQQGGMFGASGELHDGLGGMTAEGGDVGMQAGSWEPYMTDGSINGHIPSSLHYPSA